MKDNYTKEEVLNIIFQLDKWIEQSNESAETFKKNNMVNSEITSRAMSQSYLNIKQFIVKNLATGESNYVVIEKEKLKEICTDFFYWWYNQPGKNTEEGFNKYSSEVLKTKF